MDLNKLVKGAGDFRTIYIALTLLVSSVAWAGTAYFDTKYLQIADSAKIATDVEYRILKQQKAQMVIQKAYESEEQKKRLLEALIVNIQTEMDALKEIK